MRLLATTSRTYKNIRANMVAGIKSLQEHGLPYHRLVLANPGALHNPEQQKLKQVAKKYNATVEVVYGREFFLNRLRRDGEWRSRLLGLSSEPISITRIPMDLAESPWSEMPLVGREKEVMELSNSDSDVIVTGPPGVGKTRLVASLDEVFFLDHDASRDRIAEDIRWLNPKILVIDDAGRAESLIQLALSLRHKEKDIANYRLILVCWPDEAERLRGLFPRTRQPQVFSLELLERQVLDELLQTLGVTRTSAREEILNQAEGRPGWAVALADLLLRVRDGESLLKGKSILGEVHRYLSRAAFPPVAIDLLAAIAALRGISNRDFDTVGSVVGLPRSELTSILEKATKGGLVDVWTSNSLTSDRSVRRYHIRPPMLADVLVAEQAFESEVPGFDLYQLAEEWPDKFNAIAESVMKSAQLGATGARAVAESFYQKAKAVNPHLASTSLAREYASLDSRAARTALEDAKAVHEAWKAQGASPHRMEPLVELAYLVARWYLLDEAVEFLLDAAVSDPRDTNPNPGHPLRRLTDLVRNFHPDFPLPHQQRALLGSCLDRWIGEDRSPDHWRVYGAVIQSVLSPRLSAHFSAPGDLYQYRLIETVLDPGEIGRLYSEFWPPIKGRLPDAPAPTLRAGIEVTRTWLHIGSGQDKPLGNTHPQKSIQAAKAVAKKFVRDMEGLVTGQPGLAAYLERIAKLYGIPTRITLSREDEPFFKDYSTRDAQTVYHDLTDSLSWVVTNWADDQPDEVVKRLFRIREQLELASPPWTSRVQMACEILANQVGDPVAWIDAALGENLFPEAAPFVERAIREGQQLGEKCLKRLMSNPSSRWAILQSVLRGERDSQYQLVLSEIEPSDYKALDMVVMREELDVGKLRDLLTTPSPKTRGAAAAAVFAGRRLTEESPVPNLLEAEWTKAIVLLDLPATLGLEEYTIRELSAFLAIKYPDTLTSWLTEKMAEEIESEGIYDAIPFAVWEELHQLPHDYKDKIWLRFSQHPVAESLLLSHLVGTDEAWLQKALDSKLLTPEQALRTHDGSEPHPSLEGLARLLIPRGVDPHALASMAQAGAWMGPDSNRYDELVQRFKQLAQSDEPSVAKVGRAGIELYSAARERALAEERKRRIRGRS